MKKTLFSLVAMGLFASSLTSCQNNQKASVDAEGDTLSTTASAATSDSIAKPSIAKEKTGNPVLDVTPEQTVKTPAFSSEDVTNGFAKFEPLKKEYQAAIAAKDQAKIKELNKKYNEWVLEASKWGSKLPQSENQAYIDHYTTLTSQWDKLTASIK